MALELIIVTPEGESWSGEVDTVVLPGAEGDFGVLEGHERFLSPLRVGAVEIRDAGGQHWAVVSEGFADVGAEQVVVLVGGCERAEDIDRAAAEQAREAARAALDSLSSGAEDQVRRPGLEAELASAEIRIEVAGRA